MTNFGNTRDVQSSETLAESEAEIRRLTRDAILENLKLFYQIGISCFSAVRHNLLMWGHYASCHTGICLEFSTELAPFNEHEKIRKVAYSEAFPKLDVKRLKAGDFTHFIDFLLTKSQDWRYECEFRMIHKQKSHEYHYDRGALAAVYLGTRMDEMMRQIICHQLDKMPTKIFQMSLHDTDFRLISEEITYRSLDYRCIEGSASP